MGEFRDVEEIQDTPVGPGGSRPLVRLRQVATVEDGYADPESLARYNGRESIGLLLYKTADANSVPVAETVAEALADLRNEYPDVEIVIATSQAGFIRDAISNVVQALALGAGLAFLVLFIFLGDARYPLAICLSIPISVVLTCGLLYLAGVSLNIMSLGGLALGVGMLVDNSIVVLENIFRNRERGRGPAVAAADGAREVQGAITASTVTTVAVFGPIVYVRGVAGELFADLAVAVALSLAASLVVALTLLPMIAARIGGSHRVVTRWTKDAVEPWIYYPTVPPGWEAGRLFPPIGRHLREMRTGHGRQALGGLAPSSAGALERWFAHWADRYDRALAWALDHPGATLSLAAAGFALALVLGWGLPRDLMPRVEEGRYRVRVELPPGTPLETTDRTTARLERLALEDAATAAVFSRIGRTRATAVTAWEAEGVHTAVVDVRLRPDVGAPGDAVSAAVERLRAALGGGLSTNALTVESGHSTELGRMLGTGAADVEVRVGGDDLDALVAAAGAVAERLAPLPMLRNVRTGGHRTRTELEIRIAPERVARYGLTVPQVADVVEAYMRGLVATRYVAFDRRVDVLVRPSGDARHRFQNLLDHRIRGVPVRELVETHERLAPMEIRRDGRGRLVSVQADVVGGLNGALDAIRATLTDLELPGGLRLEVGGTNGEMRESFRSLGLAFGLAVALVFVVLAAQFESVGQPFVILAAVPLSAIGVVGALPLTGHGVNVMSLIGLVVLVGIVVNDAIVKVDFINQYRREGAALRAAILEAGRVRLRPIVMTTVTTVLGLAPLALGLGAGADLRAPLAIAVIGGLISATPLTLVVVPVMYATLTELGRPGGDRLT